MMRRVPVPPIHLSPGQAALVVLLVVGMVLLVFTWAALELVFGQTADAALRISGHQKPRKSPARIAIDQLEARIRGRK